MYICVYINIHKHIYIYIERDAFIIFQTYIVYLFEELPAEGSVKKQDCPTPLPRSRSSNGRRRCTQKDRHTQGDEFTHTHLL